MLNQVLRKISPINIRAFYRIIRLHSPKNDKNVDKFLRERYNLNENLYIVRSQSGILYEKIYTF